MKLKAGTRRQSGYTLYIVAFLIFVLLGLIVYYIVNLYSHPFPVRDPDSQVANTNEWWASTTTARYLSDFIGLSSPLSVDGFRVQYGFDAGLGPWVDLNHTLPDFVVIEESGYDETDFYLVASIYGSVFRISPSGTVLLDEGIAIKTLIIERSTNMVDWTGVFTNEAVIQNQINSWTDSERFPESYYRVLETISFTQ